MESLTEGYIIVLYWVYPQITSVKIESLTGGYVTVCQVYPQITTVKIESLTEGYVIDNCVVSDLPSDYHSKVWKFY